MNTGNKEYYTIGEISEITGIKQSVLRFWEDNFQELSPKKNKFGHRVFFENDIKVINEIKKYLYEDGLTIKGAKKLLQKNNQPINNLTSDIKNDLNEILSILRGIKK